MPTILELQKQEAQIRRLIAKKKDRGNKLRAKIATKKKELRALEEELRKEVQGAKRNYHRSTKDTPPRRRLKDVVIDLLLAAGRALSLGQIADGIKKSDFAWNPENPKAALGTAIYPDKTTFKVEGPGVITLANWGREKKRAAQGNRLQKTSARKSKNKPRNKKSRDRKCAYPKCRKPFHDSTPTNTRKWCSDKCKAAHRKERKQGSKDTPKARTGGRAKHSPKRKKAARSGNPHNNSQPASKVTPSQVPTQQDIISQVLKDAGKPLSKEEILQGMGRKGYEWKSSNPMAALSVAMSPSAMPGRKRLFRPVGEGLYWFNDGTVASVEDSKSEGRQSRRPSRKDIQNMLMKFFKECCERDSAATTLNTELYEAYKKWAEDHREPVLSQIDLVQFFKEAGLWPETNQGIRRWTGVRLRLVTPFKTLPTVAAATV